MLVTFAATAGMPRAVSVGKVISVPPPARALTSPAATAATEATPSSAGLSRYSCPAAFGSGRIGTAALLSGVRYFSNHAIR